MMFAWLHDIGKIYEYQIASEQAYKLTQQGYFHGHKMNGLHLVVKAQASYAPSYPQHSFDNLRHLLEVSEGNPSGGFRKPQMQEYMIVHNADRTSVVNNLYSQAYVGKSYGMAPQGKDGLKLNYRYER